MLTQRQRQAARILIVDDDPRDASRLARMLMASGYSAIREVNDPRAAADACRDFRPDAVLLDVDMPEVGGFEVLRQFDEFGADAYFPVLMIVSDDDRETCLRALASPAKDFLTKPLDPEELAARLENVLEVRFLYDTLALRESKIESVMDATGEAVVLFDVDEVLVYASRQFVEMFGLDEPPSVGASSDDLRDAIAPCFHDRYHFEESDASLAASPRQAFEDAIDLLQPQPRVLHRLVRPVFGDGGGLNGRLVAYRDVSSELAVADMKAEVTRLRAELEQEYSFANMIGRSEEMRRMYALMEQAAHSDITVLVQEESGTGKELVAKGVHAQSARKRGPFVAMNCAAVPDQLMESELFGHERGAFTGAHMRRIGRFEQAHGGTIFLDEAGDMPLELQAKLLRVLQEKEIQRVGGAASIPVDARVVAATNQNLEQAVADGAFREDLFYRLAVFCVSLPPLRERDGDVPLLAEHLLGKHATAEGKGTMEFTPGALAALVEFHWPGNIRQLDNAIQRAVVVAESNAIRLGDLPPELRLGADAAGGLGGGSDFRGILSFREAEREVLVRAIHAVGPDARRCAEALGIGRSTLYRMLKQHGLRLTR